MFELPEYATLAQQMRRTLTGKRIAAGYLGNAPHKFVWYNRTPKEFSALTRGKRVVEAYTKGRWLFIPLDPGYVLVFGECGGAILFHPSVSAVPKRYHLKIEFDDGTALSAMTRMWGAMELYEKGKELDRQYIKGMRPTPVDREFSPAYFDSLVEECIGVEKRSVKGLLTQDQLIPGLGNSIAQDILFSARLHPKRALDSLGAGERKRLYRSILDTVREVTERGGRSDELDLFGKPGGYPRKMDKNAAGRKCPACGARIEKMQYLGGACYFCPGCQR